MTRENENEAFLALESKFEKLKISAKHLPSIDATIDDDNLSSSKSPSNSDTNSFHSVNGNITNNPGSAISNSSAASPKNSSSESFKTCYTSPRIKKDSDTPNTSKSINNSSDEESNDDLWDDLKDAVEKERRKMGELLCKSDVYESLIPTYTHSESKKNNTFVSSDDNISLECHLEAQNKTTSYISLTEKSQKNPSSLKEDQENDLDALDQPSTGQSLKNKKIDRQNEDTANTGICKDFARYKFCLRGPKCSHRHVSHDGKNLESKNKSWMLIDSEHKMRKVRRMLADKMFCRNNLKMRKCKEVPLINECLGLHCAQSDADRFRMTGELPYNVWKQAAEKWAKNNKITWYARLPELFGSTSICIAYVRGSLDHDGSPRVGKGGCVRSDTRLCNYRHVTIEAFAQELGLFLRRGISVSPSSRFPSMLPLSPNLNNKMPYTYPPPPPPCFTPLLPPWRPYVFPPGWLAMPWWLLNPVVYF